MPRAAIEDHVPVIDIGPFRTGSPEDKSRVAQEVDDACRGIGFLIVSGHGVPGDLIQRMDVVCREFIALPYWEKARLTMSTDRYRGYLPMGSEDAAYSMEEERRPHDLRECFINGPFDHAYDEYHHGTGGARFFSPNVWPDKPQGFRATWEAYYSEMERLGADLMSIFAVALGLEEGFFADKIDKHITNFAMIHYPPQDDAPMSNQTRCGAHTDFGSLSIVYTDSDVGGLQVQTKSGDWRDVPCVPGTFVINVGDLMAEWTNDRWCSTWHRVVNPPRDKAGASKLSLLFFQQPNYDARIECLPTCTNADNPPKYAPIMSGEYVAAKVDRSRAPLMEEGQAKAAS
ncbi:MAG: hypothetical protein CFH39_01569 [Alphaproteobacteria bacterium MarineAlpha10_Bin2]|nr:MAG: hypothetical protein CFH39_01569 [Alphaproteobacteria bacterium MarineAlpha10_Bin2]